MLSFKDKHYWQKLICPDKGGGGGEVGNKLVSWSEQARGAPLSAQHHLYPITKFPGPRSQQEIGLKTKNYKNQ